MTQMQIEVIEENDMAMQTQEKVPKTPDLPIPKYIPDTPENVAGAVMQTKPKQKQDWKFLRKFWAEGIAEPDTADNPA